MKTKTLISIELLNELVDNTLGIAQYAKHKNDTSLLTIMVNELIKCKDILADQFAAEKELTSLIDHLNLYKIKL